MSRRGVAGGAATERCRPVPRCRAEPCCRCLAVPPVLLWCVLGGHGHGRTGGQRQLHHRPHGVPRPVGAARVARSVPLCENAVASRTPRESLSGPRARVCCSDLLGGQPAGLVARATSCGLCVVPGLTVPRGASARQAHEPRGANRFEGTGGAGAGGGRQEPGPAGLGTEATRVPWRPVPPLLHAATPTRAAAARVCVALCLNIRVVYIPNSYACPCAFATRNGTLGQPTALPGQGLGRADGLLWALAARRCTARRRCGHLRRSGWA
jgi:hypothetical protein